MTQHRDGHSSLDAATQAAWVGFRQRLADRVAEMGEGDLLVIEPVDQASPSVVLVADAGSVVEVELPDELVVLEQRRADELAVLVVRALRETYAVPHPSFLDAGGLEDDPDAPPVQVSSRAAHEPDRADEGTYDELEGVPSSPDHLRAMVDAAMVELFPDLEHDEDGDIPIVAGSSVVFVRALPSRPAVELYAEIVLEPEHRGLVGPELALLNEAHPLWKFALRDRHIVMTHEMPALPFTAYGLRVMVRRFVDEVDGIAGEIVARVGGRRFAEPAPAEDDRDTVMAGLLELLHLERVRPATVAGLFDHDRLEIIRQLVRIRRGLQSCGDRDPEVVLTALRNALRHVADGEPAARTVPHAPRRSLQEQLLAPGEGLDVDQALDLGWSA